EGAFRDWGYALAVRDYRDRIVTERESWILGNKEARPSLSVEDNAREIDPGYDLMTDDQKAKVRKEVEAALALVPTHGGGQWKSKVLVRDAIADITLQQVLTRPRDFDVIATPNLNGDYLSDALAAQVGGIGIAPGGNVNYASGHAIFEATHGTAPKYANLDKVNPGSVIVSARFGNVFVTGEPPVLSVTATASPDEPFRGRLRVQVVDAYGATAGRRTMAVVLPPGGSVTRDFAIRGRRVGYFTVKATLLA